MKKTGFERFTALLLSILLVLGNPGISALAEEQEAAPCTHDVVSVREEAGTAPGCTTDGSHTVIQFCETCGQEISRETVADAATGHDYQESARTEASAEAEGRVTYTCTRCGDQISETLSRTEQASEPEAPPAEPQEPDKEASAEEPQGEAPQEPQQEPAGDQEEQDGEPQEKDGEVPAEGAEGARDGQEETAGEPQETAGETPAEGAEEARDGQEETAGEPQETAGEAPAEDTAGAQDGQEQPAGEPQENPAAENPEEPEEEQKEEQQEPTGESQEEQQEPVEEPQEEQQEPVEEPGNPAEGTGESGEEPQETTGEASPAGPADSQEQSQEQPQEGQGAGEPAVSPAENTDPAAPAQGEQTPAVQALPFEQKETIDNVQFTVTADPGVFEPNAKLTLEKTGNADFVLAAETVLGLNDPETMVKDRIIRHKIYKFDGARIKGTAKVAVAGLGLKDLRKEYPEGDISVRVMRFHPEKTKPEEQASRMDRKVDVDEDKLSFELNETGLVDIVIIMTPAAENAEPEAEEGEEEAENPEQAEETSGEPEETEEPAGQATEGEPAEEEAAGAAEESADEPGETPEGPEESAEEADNASDGQGEEGDPEEGEEPAEESGETAEEAEESAEPAEGTGESEAVPEEASEVPADSGEEAGETSAESAEGTGESEEESGEVPEEPAEGGEEASEEPGEPAEMPETSGEDAEASSEETAESTEESATPAEEPAGQAEGADGDESEPVEESGEPAGEAAAEGEEAAEEPGESAEDGDESAEGAEEPAEKNSLPWEEPAEDGLTAEDPAADEEQKEDNLPEETADTAGESADSEENENSEEIAEGEGTADAEKADETEETVNPEETGEAEGTEGTEETGEPEETEEDEETGESEEPEETESTEETDEPEEEPVAFAASQTVAGVIVTVEAEPGTFPAGAVLSVVRVPIYQARQADSAIEELRDEEKTVAVSYTFDITVLDADGNELQPAEGKKVSVTFALAEAADENLETNVYHVTEEENGTLTAEKLDAEVDAEAETVTAQTEGFSLYTVEFTYNTLQYVLPGDEEVPLSEILATLGLSGTAERVSVSNPDLFSASDESGEWILASHQPFTTEEWMKVTIAGVTYVITVTDAETTVTVKSKKELVEALATDNKTAKLGANIQITSQIIVKKTVTIDLNGYILSAKDDVFYPLVADEGGNLTITDSSASRNGRIDGAEIGVGPTGAVTLDNITIQKSGVTIKGGSGICTMNGGTIRNYSGYIGAVWVQTGGTFIMNGGTITGCEAVLGGAIYVDSGTFIMNDGKITGNHAEDYGGAIYQDGGTVTIEKGEISDNDVEDEAGGAIYVKAGTLTIKGGTFKNNRAGWKDGKRKDGTDGGVCKMEAGKLTITGGTFSDSFADNNGGAFYLGESVEAEMSNCVIEGGSLNENTSDKGRGGAIFNKGKLTLKNVTVRNNSATRDGGGIFNASQGKLYVEKGSVISGNTTETYGGGGIYNLGTAEILEDSIIKENKSLGGNGGGVWNQGDLTIRNVSITGNVSVLGVGGGIYNKGTTRLNGKVEVTENRAFAYGGGIYVVSDTWLTVESEPVIKDNTTGDKKKASNVFLVSTDDKINISDRLTDKATIGVSSAKIPTKDSPIYLTSHLNQSGYGDETNFFSDNPIYWIGLKDYEAVLWPSTITFEPGDPNTSGTMNPVTADTTTLVLPSCKYTHNQGRAFLGWMIDGDAENVKPAFAEIPISGNMTVTAIWETPWRSIQKNIDNAANGGTVTVGMDTEAETNDVALVIPEGKNITLDLNGYLLDRNLKKPANNGSAIRVMDGATLTITDSRSGGRITRGYTSNANTGGGVSLEGGTLILKGGTISGNKASGGMGKDIFLSDKQSITLSGLVTIGDLHVGKMKSIVLSGTLDPASSIGVSFDWTSGFPRYITSGFGTQANRTTLVQCFHSKVDGYGIGVDVTDAENPEAYINTAVTVSFEEIDNMPDVTLAKGSSFTVPLCDKVNHPGTSVNGYWKVKNQTSVTYYRNNTEPSELQTIKIDTDITLVAVWEMTWEMLHDAIVEAGTTPTTFRLSQKLEAKSTDTELTIGSGQDITVDLNGYTLDRKLYGTAKPNGHVFAVESGGSLTIIDSQGKGKITGGNSKTYGGGIYVASGANLTMTGGTVTDNTTGSGSQGSGIYVAYGASFKVDGPVKVTGNLNNAGKKDNVYLEKHSAAETNDALIETGFSFQGGQISVTSAFKPTTEAPVVYLTKGLNFAEGSFADFTSDVTTYAIGEGQGGEAILGTPAKIYLLDANDKTRSTITAVLQGVYTLAEATFVPENGDKFTGWKRVQKQSNGSFTPVGEGQLLNAGEKLLVDEKAIYLRAVFGTGIGYIDQYGNPLFRTAGDYLPLNTVTETGITDVNAQVKVGPGWYAVTENQTFEKHRLQIVGEVNLILCDGTTLTALKGINLPEGSTLHVWCQQGRTGTLVATTEVFHHAGIGGNYFEAGGTYVQHGGKVTATAGRNGAGVGGGYGRSAGNITIYSGSLTATGGLYGAGIGAGMGANQNASSGGAIVIWGGDVTATGGSRAAGIGGGQRFVDENHQVLGGDGGPVSIWGGNVKAKGGAMAAGIGGGVAGHGGNVKIGGGCVVEAIAGDITSEAEAIGRGGIAERIEQTEGDHAALLSRDLRLAATCMVIAGETKAEAEQVPDNQRVESCRMPYAKITSGRVAQYLIGVTPNSHVTVDVYNAEKDGTGYKVGQDEITTADPGDVFAVVIMADEESWLGDNAVSATYLYGGEQNATILSKTEKKDKDGHVTETTIFYEMPRGDVTITVNPTVTTYSILYPTANVVGHGSLEIQVQGKTLAPESAGTNLLKVTAFKGDMVTIQVNIPEEYSNYFIDTLDVKDSDNNDVKKRMGETEDKWVFEMPSSDVTINVTLGEGLAYIDENGTRQVRRYYFTITSANDLKSRDWEINDRTGQEDGWYTFKGTGEIVIDHIVKIKRNARFILQDGQKVTFKQGIIVARKDGGALQIFAQHIDVNEGNTMGTLVAIADDTNHAGIGGIGDTPSGAITINGGNIIATGDDDGPGIGSGDGADYDDITIRNARVIATGGEDSAGIGSGKHGKSGRIEIFSGYIEATGGKYGAGIGSGNQGKFDGEIIIHDGKIYAYGGEDAAAIGAGKEATATAGKVTINGGDIMCKSFDGGAGIGSGSNRDACTVAINGGDIYIESKEDGACIGGGNKGNGGSVTINGGVITMVSKDGACIGGGNKGNGGNVVINGGRLFLNTSNKNGPYLIGSGADGGSRGTLKIYPEAMVAKNIKSYTGNLDLSLSTLYYMIEPLRGDARKNYTGLYEHVLIEPCNHMDCTYEQKNDEVHILKCDACLATDPIERPHVYDNDQDPDCNHCGYSRVREINSSVSPQEMTQRAGYSCSWHKYGELSNTFTGPFLAGNKYMLKIDIPVGYRYTDVSSKYWKNGRETKIQDLAIYSQDDSTVIFAFTMPFADTGNSNRVTTIAAVFEKIQYRIFVDDGSETHGEVTPSVYTATMDELVRVYLTPEEHYIAGDVTVIRTDTEEEYAKLTPTNNATSFTMPASDVRISGAFQELPNIYWVLQNADGTWTNAVVEGQGKPTGTIIKIPPYRNLNEYAAYGYSFGNTYSMDPLHSDTVQQAASYSTVDLARFFGKGNMYIYYERREYSLTFYADIAGTRVFRTVKVRYGDKLSVGEAQIAEDFKKAIPEGYTFAGWAEKPKTSGEYDYHETLNGYENEGFTNKLLDLSTMTMPAGTMKLYPIFIRYRVAIILDLGAYDSEISDNAVLGEYYQLYYDLVGMNKYPDHTTPAHMDSRQRRTFMANIGEKIEMNGEKYGVRDSGMNQAYRTGYGLAGWYTKRGVKWTENMGVDPEYCDRGTDGKPVLHDDYFAGKHFMHYTITLEAHWALRWANVVYKLNGGTINGNPDDIRAANAVIPNGQVEITQEGPTPPAGEDNKVRIFVGWQDKTGSIYQKGERFYYRNLDRVTTYGTGAYSFDDNNKRPNSSNNVIELTAVYELVPAGRGWVVFASGEDATTYIPVPVPIPAGETQVTVYITINAAGTAFDVELEEPDGENGTKRTKINTTPYAVPVRTGFEFETWTIPSTGSNSYVDASEGIIVEQGKGTTVYAIYTQQQFSITYNGNGGPIEIGTVQYYYGNTINPTAYLTEEKNELGVIIQEATRSADGHYKFAGWMPALPTTMPAENLTVTATWDPVDFRIILDANGGLFTKQNEDKVVLYGVYGSTIIPPDDPVLEGHVFRGWKLDKNGEVVNLPAYMPDNEPTYYAFWKEDKGRPDAPVIESETDTSLTVTARAGEEYAIALKELVDNYEAASNNTYVPEEGDWILPTVSTLIFDGLTPVTEYYVYARYAETDTVAVSEASEPATGKTLKMEQGKPQPPLLAPTNDTMTVANTEMHTVEYRILWDKEDAGWPENIWVSVTEQGAADEKETVVVFRKENADGSMTKLTEAEISALPYAARNVNGQLVFINLEPDQPYAVVGRYMENEDHYKSPASDESKAYTTKNRLTSVKLEGETVYGKTLTAVVNQDVQDDPMLTYLWYRNDERITLKDADGNEMPVSGNKYTLRGEDVGCTIHVVAVQEFNTGTRITKEDAVGPVQKLDNDAIPDPVDAIPAPTTLTVIDPVDENGGGLYEYSRDLINWQTDTVFDGLTEETDYTLYVRYAATESHGASQPSDPAEFRTTKKLLKTVKIEGEAVYGTELTAVIDPEDANNVSLQWYRLKETEDGESVEEAIMRTADADGDPLAEPVPYTGDSYVLTEEDIGCIISVRATQTRRDNDPIVRNDMIGPVQKAPQEQPDNLDAETTETTLEVTEPLNNDEHEYEYRINGRDWQDSPLFEELTPDTEYTVYARVKETPTHAASEPMIKVFQTKKMVTAVFLVYQDTEGKWNEPEEASDETVDTYTVEAQEGFTAVGYSTAFEAEEEERSETAEEEEITLQKGTAKLYVYYARNTYQVTFLDGETVLAEETLYYEAKITAPTAPVKEGHTFTKWDPEVPGTMPAKDMTFQAVYEKNSYTLTFMDGETKVGKVTALYGEKVTAPTAPVKEGHTFTKWDPEVPGTMPAKDMTFQAAYEKNSYTLTFMDGETEVGKVTALYGEKVTAPTAPAKEGYTFTGWDAEVPETVPAKDMTFQAVYEKKSYTLTFMDGETEVGKVTALYGEKATAPAAPAKEGYTFTGWDPKVPETVPAKDMTFQAVYEKNSYTLVFMDGGTEVGKVTALYGENVTAPTAPAKEGYTFKGWNPEVPETVPAKDMTFQAVYEKNSEEPPATTYTLTFMDGETEVGKVTGLPGEQVTAPDPPVKEGYVFSHWEPEVPETMPAEDRTFQARWQPGKITTELILGDGVQEITLKDLTDEEVLKIAGPEAAALREAGAPLSLVIEINNIDGTVSEADKKLVQDALTKKNRKAKAFEYLDIAVYMKIGSGERIQLTDLNGQDLTLTVTVPVKNRNTKKDIVRTFYVVRVHAGAADVLTSGSDTKQTFRSSLFSTYALGESDQSKVNTGDNSHLELWIALLALLVVGFVVFNAVRRKKTKGEHE